MTSDARLAELLTGRTGSFRRFQIGTLPNGREEWLEFWKTNHLLPPFDELHARREVGVYGGRPCDFLSLPDLIRSKETEREKDWLDIQYLEEAFDARNAAAVASGRLSPAVGLSTLRSRRGLETHLMTGLLADAAVNGDALGLAAHPVTVALLLPATDGSAVAHVQIEPIIRDRLQTVPVGAPLHWALVEAVRRRYKMQAMDADRADKLAIRESLNRTDQ